VGTRYKGIARNKLMSTTRQELEARAKSTILKKSFLGCGNIAIVLIALFLAFIIGVGVTQSWLWALAVIALGVASALGLGVLRVRSADLNAQAVADALEQKFKPESIRLKRIRDKTNKALEYFQEIEAAVVQTKEGVLRDRLQRTTDEVLDWVESIYGLASRIDGFYREDLVQRDLKSVPRSIDKLKRQLEEEEDDAVKAQIEETIGDREQQLANLERLQNSIESAELQLDRTLSALGTVYSQVLQVGAKDGSTERAQRLQAEISEQVHQLQDLSEAMDEVYAER